MQINLYEKDSKQTFRDAHRKDGFVAKNILESERMKNRTIVGCRRERAKLILKVFRKKKTIKSWYDDFYYMHDNGADGHDFLENADKWYVIGVRKVIKN